MIRVRARVRVSLSFWGRVRLRLGLEFWLGLVVDLG